MTKFQPGQSGNPGGRSRQNPKIRELAVENSEEALLTVVALMKNKRCAPSTRLAACNSILDRAYGKPGSSVELTGKDGTSLKPDHYEGWTEPAKRIDMARRILWMVHNARSDLAASSNESAKVGVDPLAEPVETQTLGQPETKENWRD